MARKILDKWEVKSKTGKAKLVLIDDIEMWIPNIAIAESDAQLILKSWFVKSKKDIFDMLNHETVDIGDYWNKIKKRSGKQ